MKDKQINDFELEYTLYQFPSPIRPMSYKIKIDGTGRLVKKYEGYSDVITRYLSQSELSELIDLLQKNEFFKLPKNVNGVTNITDQPSRYLSIKYNGKYHNCDGYNTKNKKYIMICDFIENLEQLHNQSNLGNL